MHHTEKSRGLPTTDTADFEFTAPMENMPTARGGNRMPKIPDAADGIEVLHATKCKLELRRGAGLKSIADRASPGFANVQGGCTQQPAAALPPTPGR